MTYIWTISENAPVGSMIQQNAGPTDGGSSSELKYGLRMTKDSLG